MESARVLSIDDLKTLRAALLKFAETARTVMGDADAELQRTLSWLETEQTVYWEGQIRSRTEAVARAKDAVRSKVIYRPKHSRPSAVEEEKALRLAQQRLEEAHQKLAAVKRSIRVLQKESHQYKSQVQRFVNNVAIDLPLAANLLERLVLALEAYLKHRMTAEATAERPMAEIPWDDLMGPSMARPEPAEETERQREGEMEGRSDKGTGGPGDKGGVQ
jgi:hypothetical protein